MANIQKRPAMVYMAPTAGRRFFTAKAAANAEASSMLKKKWPNERADYEEGRMTYPGWTWRDDEDLVRLHARVMRMILRRLKSSAYCE